MNKIERITNMLGLEVAQEWNGNTDWHIPTTTVRQMSEEVHQWLQTMGCNVFDVDTTREPYYYVCVRLGKGNVANIGG